MMYGEKEKNFAQFSLYRVSTLRLCYHICVRMRPLLASVLCMTEFWSQGYMVCIKVATPDIIELFIQ
jgi:hypothetical protein